MGKENDDIFGFFYDDRWFSKIIKLKNIKSSLTQ